MAPPTPPPPAPPPLIERRRALHPVPRTVSFEVSAGTMLKLVLVVAALWPLIRLAPILLVLVVALFIVGTMGPAVTWLEERRVRRNLGIAFVFTMLFFAMLFILTLTISSILAQAASLFDREPAFRAGLVNYLSRFHMSTPLADWLRNAKYVTPGSTVGATAFAYSMRIFEITAYIRGQLVTSLLISAFTFILLTVCGVENALALAVFAGVADVLPYIGGFLSVGRQ